MRTHMVSCCDREDAPLCMLLCRSIDRFIAAEIRHSIVVPIRDYDVFRPLATKRREVIVAEEVLGPDFQQVPHARRAWTYRQLELGGWYVQQLLKLATPAFAQEDIILHLDSDMWFVRPLDERRLMNGDRVRLYRRPGAAPPDSYHVPWHRAAAGLLGMQPTDYFGANFIAPAITWRRSTILALHDYLQRQSGLPWLEVLATREGWSEYTLYGVFVTGLGVDRDRHFVDNESMCHVFWHATCDEGPERDAELEVFVQGLRMHQLAVLVQSTVPLIFRQREDLYRKSFAMARPPDRWPARGIAERARTEPPASWGPWMAFAVRYLEHCAHLPADAGILRRLTGLPSYLRRQWGMAPAWRLPLMAVSKYRRRRHRGVSRPARVRRSAS